MNKEFAADTNLSHYRIGSKLSAEVDQAAFMAYLRLMRE
jgi:hypothetical protein